MRQYTIDKYRIDIYADQTFIEGSADNVNHYDAVYFDKSEYRFSSVFGIKVFHDNTLIKNAVIGSVGGGTCIHDTSTRAYLAFVPPIVL